MPENEPIVFAKRNQGATGNTKLQQELYSLFDHEQELREEYQLPADSAIHDVDPEDVEDDSHAMLLATSPDFLLDRMLLNEELPPFIPPPHLHKRAQEVTPPPQGVPPHKQDLSNVMRGWRYRPPTLFEQLLPAFRKRYTSEVTAARRIAEEAAKQDIDRQHQVALLDYQQTHDRLRRPYEEYLRRERERTEQLNVLERAHTDANTQRHAAIHGYNVRVEAVRSMWHQALNDYRSGDNVVSYFETILTFRQFASACHESTLSINQFAHPDFETSLRFERPQSRYPENFRLAYVPSPKQLVIDYELPTLSMIPPKGYRYVKARFNHEPVWRSATEAKRYYRELIASITLKTLNEVFEVDSSGAILIIVFNGFVRINDPATGQAVRPYLISVRVTRETFQTIDVGKVDPSVCLRHLGAQVSSKPSELLAVKPIIEFDMLDKRFIAEQDVMSSLDSRQNLMDLNPYEFEALVSNLFTKLGLESKLTRTNRDGGVDAVAFDLRPILGGKVIIQAKRWRNIVGVAAARDLYGTMINEGANKGILVTTSYYGPDTYDFCRDKPIELIDGQALLHYLEEVGVKARIDFGTMQSDGADARLA